MINPKEYGSGLVTLTADSLDMTSGDVVVLEVESVDPNMSFDRDGKTQKRVAITFKGQDDPYILNQTSLKRMVAALGADERKWLGESVPLIGTDQTNPQSGEAVTSLWVCDPKVWERHLTGHKKAAKKSSRR